VSDTIFFSWQSDRPGRNFIERALKDGKQDEAGRLFQQSVDTGVTNFIEFTASQAELKRLGGCENAADGSLA